MAEKKGNKEKQAPEPARPDSPRASRRGFASWIKGNKLRLLVILVAAAALIGGLVWWLRPGTEQLTNDQIVTEVNKQLSISGDGNPAVLDVIDEQKIEQPFLEQAKNGDKVILYYKAKKAVLFRPGEKRIVHQGTYTPPAAKVFLREGTNDSAKIAEAKDKLEQVDEIDLASQDNSPSKDHRGITLVSVTDRYDDKLQELSKLFDVPVSRLPAGESFPDADILIIVGN